MIGIGKGGAHDETTAPGLVRGCHRRIRHFGALAEKIAASTDAPAAELADAASAVHRYFTVALPLHHDDEERTLLPRLEGSSALAEPLARMREQHHEMDDRLARLVPLWARLLREPHAAPALKEELVRATAGFAAFLEAHLTLEESSILPALEALEAPVQDEILREMRARRAG